MDFELQLFHRDRGIRLVPRLLCVINVKPPSTVALPYGKCFCFHLGTLYEATDSIASI